MNYSSLPVYYSKENLTLSIADKTNVFILPSICLFGMLTSLPCIMVSFKRDHSNAKIFDYILINSANDFCFLLVEFFVIIIRCGNLCPYGYTFASKVYELFVFQYVGYIFVTSQVFFNIYFAYDRLKMFSGKLTTQKPLNIYIVLAICTVISALVNTLPYPLFREITVMGLYKPDPNSTYTEILYTRSIRKIFTTPIMQNLLVVWLVIKNPVLFLFLTFMNVMVVIRFRAYLKSRKHLLTRTGKYRIIKLKILECYNVRIKISNKVHTTTTASVRADQQTGSTNESTKSKASSDRKENNFTLLTLVYCAKLLIGNFIDAFSIIMTLFGIDTYVKYGFINLVGNGLFFASHSLSFFLYFFFYNIFREQFMKMFCFRK